MQQMHTALMALTSYEANAIVAISRKNPLEAWRKVQKRYDPTTSGRKRNLLRTIISPGRCSLLELQAEIERWESYVSRNEKKMKDKLDDEVKLASLEALVLRGRTSGSRDVEAKFGLRTRDSKPGDTGSRRHSDSIDVDAVNSLSSSNGKGSSSPQDGCFKCGGAHVQRDGNARKGNGMQSSCKNKQSKRVRTKERVKSVRRHPKENPQVPKVPKVRTRVTSRKLVHPVSKIRNQRQVEKLWNLHRRIPLLRCPHARAQRNHEARASRAHGRVVSSRAASLRSEALCRVRASSSSSLEIIKPSCSGSWRSIAT